MKGFGWQERERMYLTPAIVGYTVVYLPSVGKRRINISERTIIIVGAGIAGLAAGCYARMNGYHARIFEQHDKPGGYCTAWTRKGYTFDGCIHHLAGAGPHSTLYPLWRDLGIFEGHTMHFYDKLVQVELADGRRFVAHTDVDRLEAYLKHLAPEDASVIDEYIRAARSFLAVDLLGLPMASPWQTLKALPKLPLLLKWGKVTLEQFAKRFKNPLLRQAFPTLQYDFSGIPMLIHLNFLAGCHNRILGWPSGGSLAFARTIAARCESLGGEIHYRSPVGKILVENDRAVGVRLRDGTEHRSDFVVSAADGYTTIFGMLDSRYADARIRSYYDAAPDGNEMNFCVALGVARDMKDEPHALTLFLKQPVTLLGRPHERLSVEVYNWDPSLAPAGKTPIKVLLKTTYSQWKALSADRARYDEEKARVAETVIDVLEARFPGLRQQVDVVDGSTPLTIERFTGNYHGLQAWRVPGGRMGAMLRGFTRTLPGLANFHMAGQWAEAMIGISTAAISGRNAVQRVCKQDGRRFRAGGADD